MNDQSKAYFPLTRKVLSQLPVQRAIPSELTPKQLTRFSWPVRTPTRSPLSVSQTLHVQSSYPPNKMRPEMEKATEVIPQRILSCVNAFSSLSALISKSLQEASSEPVAKASPFGKNLGKKELEWKPISKSVYLRDSVDIGFVSSECLSGLATPDVPQFGSCVTSTRYEDILVRAEG